jgi:homopolymeric O-antigen transport system permease protein
VAVVASRNDDRWQAALGSAGLLRTHGRLLARVTLNDLRQRYAGSLLGLGWAILAPLLVLTIYAVIYLEIFRIRVATLDSREYVIYVFCGLVPYLATAEAIGQGVTAVISNKSVLNNTVFPIDLTPIKPVLAVQAVMASGMTIVLAGAFATGNVHPTLVLLPVIWALNALWLAGINWLLSLLNVIFRDLQNLVGSVLMVMLVASPIAYTPDMVPPSLKLLLALNPFAYFVVAYQQVVMLGIWPSTPHLIILVVMSLATFALGSWFFWRTKRVIIDYV